MNIEQKFELYDELMNRHFPKPTFKEQEKEMAYLKDKYSYEKGCQHDSFFNHMDGEIYCYKSNFQRRKDPLAHGGEEGRLLAIKDAWHDHIKEDLREYLTYYEAPTALPASSQKLSIEEHWARKPQQEEHSKRKVKQGASLRM